MKNQHIVKMGSWPAMASHLEWSYRRTLKYSVGRAASPTRRDAAERNAGT